MLRLKAAIFLLIALIYLFFASGLPWIEADVQLSVTKNLIFKKSLSLDGHSTAFKYSSTYDGRHYDIHGLTNVLLFIPMVILQPVLGKLPQANTKQIISFLGSLTGVLVNTLCMPGVFFITGPSGKASEDLLLYHLMPGLPDHCFSIFLK